MICPESHSRLDVEPGREPSSPKSQFSALFTTSYCLHLERCVMSEAGDCSERKDGRMVKVVECCPNKLDCVLDSLTEILYDAH